MHSSLLDNNSADPLKAATKRVVLIDGKLWVRAVFNPGDGASTSSYNTLKKIILPCMTHHVWFPPRSPGKPDVQREPDEFITIFTILPRYGKSKNAIPCPSRIYGIRVLLAIAEVAGEDLS